jgi:uncharacterized membrane protein
MIHSSFRPIPHAFTARFVRAGYLIGFALGGFFDGVLLHQILQWHHLLSALPAEALRDLRMQVFADGVFHALMYVIGAAGLWMLYRARRDFSGARADRILLGATLIGFGAWHVLDALVSHWLLGIHRIRMDVGNPLAWDIGWLVVFGLTPLFAGFALRRRHPRDAAIPDRRGASRAVALGLAACTAIAGAWAALPDGSRGDRGTVTVVLRPDVRAGEFLSTLDARVLWSDAAGGVWVLAADGRGSALDLYRRGAMWVSGTLAPAGCFAWVRG